MRTEQDIRDQLEYLLARDKKKVDYGMVLDLASQLSEHDTENVRFAVDGNLVKRLGEQLVAKKTTALAELIKNSYDAEASKVNVIFENTEEPSGTITIEDDGNGMTKEALIKGFMTISTSDKEDNPLSPLYERPRAGRKGIGRFSAQKIGDLLTIITRTSKNEPYLVVEIDWSNYQAKSNLLTIANSIKESEFDYGFDKGTKLVIGSTREPWKEQNMATTYKYITSVIKTSSKETSPGTIDPGFNVLFHTVIPLTGEVTPIQLLETEILNNATATIEAQLNDKFEVEIKIEGLKKLKVSETFVLSGFETDALRQANFKFNLHYFPLTTGARSAHIVNYLNENGGIRLYRNGFSVAPYGEKYNDWLGLDDSARRRKILAPHANLNFIGSAEILDVTGKIFDETSSREGLINNDAFKELRDALYQIVIEAVKRITSARGKKVTASQQGYLKENQTIEEKLDSSSNKLLEDVRKLNVSEDDTSTDDNSTNLDLFSDEIGSDSNSNLSPFAVAQSLKETLEEQQQYIQELIDEKNMYRVLSSTGLAIAEFTHEIQLYLDGLMLSGKQLKRLVDDNNEALDSVGKMDSNIDMLVSYTDFFTETIRNNSQRQKNPIEIRDVFKAFFDAMRPTIERRSYMLDISFQGDEFWTRPMHISELSSVLMNLFTNACKAIIRSGQPNGRLKVQVTSTDDDHIIRFEDNGDGIPKENWGRVFNALFTTELSQGVYASESEQMKGMGLGLTITQDIIYGLDGDISVVEPSVGYKTCIEIVLPKAKENEIPEDAY